MCYGILLAAGQGRRLVQEAQKPKQYLPYKGKPLWWHSVNTFQASPQVQGLILVFDEENIEFSKIQLEEYKKDFALPVQVVCGGKRRQDSVKNALDVLPKECKYVAIHDTARPFASTALLTKAIQFLLEHKEYTGVVPSLAVSDTIKIVNNISILSTPKRENLKAVQTPQVFSKEKLIEAHNFLIENKLEVTDDAMALEHIHEKVACIDGEVSNKKITYSEDLNLLEEKKEVEYISTYGYDVHAYTNEFDSKARPFKLATIPIPSSHYIKAHSDGDVLLHALMDALLALASLGDIGTHFPDKDKEYENISSAILLDKVLALLLKEKYSYTLTHIDITLVAQEPKISPFVAQIRKNLANLLLLPLEKISVKATTEEKLGFTGELKGIKAIALVSAMRTDKK